MSKVSNLAIFHSIGPIGMSLKIRILPFSKKLPLIMTGSPQRASLGEGIYTE